MCSNKSIMKCTYFYVSSVAGRVYIYYGKQDGTINLNPETTISCTEVYCNFGLTLTSGHLDSDEYMDLLVGSPYAPSGGSSGDS